MIYAAATPSLALLENIVHMAAIPSDEYCLAKLVIPDNKIAEIKESELPSDWAKYPSPDKLKAIGDKFIKDNIFLALKIPSTVLPVENIILLNPNHIDFIKVKIEDARNLPIDVRFFEK